MQFGQNWMSISGGRGVMLRIDAAEVARPLAVTLLTVRGFIERGELAAFRMGRVIRVRVVELQAFIESCRIELRTLDTGHGAVGRLDLLVARRGTRCVRDQRRAVRVGGGAPRCDHRRALGRVYSHSTDTSLGEQCALVSHPPRSRPVSGARPERAVELNYLAVGSERSPSRPGTSWSQSVPSTPRALQRPG